MQPEAPPTSVTGALQVASDIDICCINYNRNTKKNISVYKKLNETH